MLYKFISFAITLLYVAVAASDISRYNSEKKPFVFDVQNIENKYFVVKVYIGGDH